MVFAFPFGRFLGVFFLGRVLRPRLVVVAATFFFFARPEALAGFDFFAFLFFGAMDVTCLSAESITVPYSGYIPACG